MKTLQGGSAIAAVLARVDLAATGFYVPAERNRSRVEHVELVGDEGLIVGDYRLRRPFDG